jgi:adenine-specific DNA methylase
MKESIAEKTKERWHGKRMHGQWPRKPLIGATRIVTRR